MKNINFIPLSNNKVCLHFQCSNNMTIDDILYDIKQYILEHKEEIDLTLDRTELPIYLKRYKLIRDPTLWMK